MQTKTLELALSGWFLKLFCLSDSLISCIYPEIIISVSQIKKKIIISKYFLKWQLSERRGWLFNPNLGDLFKPCWFNLNTSETVEAVTLAFCSIQYHFIRDIRAKFGICNLPQSPDIGQDSDGGISDFQIYSQSLIKENFHNTRTRDNIDMKLRPVTKLDKRNKKTVKKLTRTSFW